MNTRIGLFVIFVVSAFITGEASKWVRSIISVSHVVRQGNTIEETRIGVFKDRRYFLDVIRQELPNKPKCQEFTGVMLDENFKRITVFMQSEKFTKLQTGTKVSNSGSAWYVASHFNHTKFLAFTEDSEPPKTVVSWFEEIAKLKAEPSENLNKSCEVFSQEAADYWRK